MGAKSSDDKCGQLVLPGDRLGVIEEFIPDTGTYVKDGVIYSRVVGRALLDLASRRVSVYPVVDQTKVPNIGSVVMGQVSNVQSDSAMLKIFRVGERDLSGVFMGLLHVSDVQMRYVDSMFDVCKVGDVMRAQVVSDKNRTFHLSTKDKNLGVLYAFCSRCGHMLEPRQRDLICPSCGNDEIRKTTSDYGKDAM
jgi:exosome complex component CSL4